MTYRTIQQWLRHCAEVQFQALSLRAVYGLGIVVWSLLIIQLQVEGRNDSAPPAAEKIEVMKEANDDRVWHLTSIVSGIDRPRACINGQWVGIGDELSTESANAEIVNIDGKGVQISSRGELIVLRIREGDVAWNTFEVTRR